MKSLFSLSRCGILPLICVLAGVRAPAADDRVLDLAGTWTLQLDPDDAGMANRWFERTGEQQIHLPGSLQAQGFGLRPSLDTRWTGSIRPEVFQMPRYAPYREADNFKMPFWLQPKHYYVGPAWYQRSVTIPADWSGRRITLFLERCHWFTTVWVDGQEVGQGESLSVPHVFDLSTCLTPGPHRLTIRVDNRLQIDVGENSHSVTDHTQTNWNGIVGRMELRVGPSVWLDDVQVFPDIAQHAARIHVTLRNRTGAAADVKLQASVSADQSGAPPVEQAVTVTGESLETDILLPLGTEPKWWDEHHPNLYALQLRMTGAAEDATEVKFGMRQVATDGPRFLMNQQPIQFRGTLECAIFPLTGYPATDVEAWKTIIRRVKEFGLNHMRFHSWCPPEAAFIAADELGCYFQIECASWANGGASVGNGTPLDEWLYRETDRILQAYGNHPSFVLLAYGNEPAGPGPQQMGEEYLARWVNRYKAQAPRQLVTCAAGWPYLAESQYHVMHAPLRQHRQFDAQPPETTKDYGQQVARYAVPLISHETGQWCVFPNLAEMPAYSGVLEPKNFEIVRDFLAQHGLLPQAHDFLMASGRFQTLLYKEEIEVLLRTPNLGGFQLLDLHDFPGQGTALIGVLDPFWNPKPYVTAQQFRRFCAPVVPLARMSRRVWTSDQQFSAAIDISQFGGRDVNDVTVEWTLRSDSGKTIGEGRWSDVDLPAGGLREVGTAACPLAAVHQASRLTLTVALRGTPVANDWQIWVYPPITDPAPAADVLVARALDDAAQARLKQGGKVLLLPPKSTIAGDTTGFFEPVFWNRLWFPTQEVHTLGLVCNPQHPALAAFPTDAHSNWQWWDLCRQGKPLVLDGLPAEIVPIVQPIDDWNTCRKLGLVFEAQVEQGKLLVCAIDLVQDLEQRPVARQLRHSLLQYMASAQFAPTVAAPLATVQQLFRAPSWLELQGATVRATTQQPGFEAERTIDGRPDTIWHTPYGASTPPHPHELVLDLQGVHEIRGLTCLPRQEMSNGRIGKYEIFASADGAQWGPALATGQWPDAAELQTVPFTQPVQARYVKLVALSEVRGNPWAAVAELDVLR